MPVLDTLPAGLHFATYTAYVEIPVRIRRQFGSLYLHRYDAVPKWRKDWRTGKARCLATMVLTDDGTLVAWGMYWQDPNTLRLHYGQYTRPSHRRRGLGRLAMREARAQAEKQWPGPRQPAVFYGHDPQACAYFEALGWAKFEKKADKPKKG